MRCRFLYVMMVLAALPLFAAENDSPALPETAFVARTGVRMQSHYEATYHLYEFSQQRGRWLWPDLGYYDSGKTNDQLWFAGAGGDIIRNNRVELLQIVYVEQEVGRDAHNQRAIWIWPVLDVQLTPRLSSETVVYPTIPIDRSQRWAFDVDRSKLEYQLRRNLKAGAGYSASVGAECDWFSKPFLTTTLTNRTGSWEFWIQRISGGAQLQVRYTLTHTGSIFRR